MVAGMSRDGHFERTGPVRHVVWDTRLNRPASAAIHRQFGCVPDARLPVASVLTTVTPDMGMFTVDERQMVELFHFATTGERSVAG
jgi:hypothetical protein